LISRPMQTSLRQLRVEVNALHLRNHNRHPSQHRVTTSVRKASRTLSHNTSAPRSFNPKLWSLASSPSAPRLCSPKHIKCSFVPSGRNTTKLLVFGWRLKCQETQTASLPSCRRVQRRVGRRNQRPTISVTSSPPGDGVAEAEAGRGSWRALFR